MTFHEEKNHTENASDVTPHAQRTSTSAASEHSSKNPESIQDTQSTNNASPSILAMAQEALTVSRSFFELASLEFQEATGALPKVIGIAFLAFFFAVFAWLSLSAGIGWLAYLFLGSAGWGILAFLLMQIVSILICRSLITKYVRVLGLPNTRQFIQNFRGANL